MQPGLELHHRHAGARAQVQRSPRARERRVGRPRGIDPGESPTEAVIREVREETGLEAEVEALYGVYWRRDIDGLLFAFRCRVTGGTLQPDGGEIVEARYFPTDALPRPITNGTLLRIADARAGAPLTVKTLERLEYLR